MLNTQTSGTELALLSESNSNGANIAMSASAAEEDNYQINVHADSITGLILSSVVEGVNLNLKNCLIPSRSSLQIYA